MREILEASMPFGRTYSTTGMTFGFEAELIAELTAFQTEIDLSDFGDDDELMDELGCDERETREAFEAWRADHGDDDSTMVDWIDAIGEAQFWDASRATGNWHYALVRSTSSWDSSEDKGEIVRISRWEDAMEQFADEFDTEFGGDVDVAYGDENIHDKKDYASGVWYLEKDPSVGSDNDHGFELISPVYDDYELFKRDVEWFFRWLQEHYKGEIRSGSSTGFHVNIGIKGRDVDPLKLLLFGGEKWMAKAWGREDNQHTQALLPQLLDAEGLPRSPEAAREILMAYVDDIHEKHWVINLQTLLSRGYIEFRPIGNADYEKKWVEVEQHMDRMIQLIHIATTPDKFRREYQKKLGKLIGGAPVGRALTTDERQVANWMGTMNLASYVKNKVVDAEGRLIIDPETLMALVGASETYWQRPIPNPALKALLRASNLKAHYGDLVAQYDLRLPFGLDHDGYEAARRRLDPLLGFIPSRKAA